MGSEVNIMRGRGIMGGGMEGTEEGKGGGGAKSLLSAIGNLRRHENKIRLQNIAPPNDDCPRT